MTTCGCPEVKGQWYEYGVFTPISYRRLIVLCRDDKKRQAAYDGENFVKRTLLTNGESIPINVGVDYWKYVDL